MRFARKDNAGLERALNVRYSIRTPKCKSGSAKAERHVGNLLPCPKLWSLIRAFFTAAVPSCEERVRIGQVNRNTAYIKVKGSRRICKGTPLLWLSARDKERNIETNRAK